MISTFTMLFDITWFEALIYSGGYENASKIAKIARASRVSKIGANSSKLIRILRLIRLLKMHKHTSEAKKDEDTIRTDRKEADMKCAISLVAGKENSLQRV
jgi:hypothetical protein